MSRWLAFEFPAFRGRVRKSTAPFSSSLVFLFFKKKKRQLRYCSCHSAFYIFWSLAEYKNSCILGAFVFPITCEAILSVDRARIRGQCLNSRPSFSPKHQEPPHRTPRNNPPHRSMPALSEPEEHSLEVKWTKKGVPSRPCRSRLEESNVNERPTQRYRPVEGLC
ncbi:hypothetical protein VTI74DRAFT_911 [Chaetomium olivicolor]